MRALILADDCNPEWSSLPSVGYKACRALADHVDATVVTHVRNREAIEKRGMGKAQVVYVDNEYIAAPLYRMSKILRGGSSMSWTTAMAFYYPSYLAFEWEVWKRFEAELRAGRFDLVHRLTPMSPTKASPMAKWSPVPFVLGPINGGLKWPPEFLGELHKEREWLTFVRGAYKALPYHKATYTRAAAILAGFQHTIADLPEAAREKAIEFPEVGMDPELFGEPAAHGAKERVTFVFVGRLVPLKLLDVAVRAFAESEILRRHRLLVIGDGPERAPIEALVRERKLEGTVEFAGWLEQDEVGRRLRESDVFVFPSIRDLGAGVVIEAMACGLPCVVTDYGGPGGLVRPDVGVKIPLGKKDALVPAYRRELEALAQDHARRAELGRAAFEHAHRHFSWDAKARKTVAVYRWALEGGTKPDFYTE